MAKRKYRSTSGKRAANKRKEARREEARRRRRAKLMADPNEGLDSILLNLWGPPLVGRGLCVMVVIWVLLLGAVAWVMW